MKTASLLTLAIILAGQSAFAQEGYEFKGGYPTPETIQKAYDDADLTRAITAYKFFYPTVSILATFEGNARAGMAENKNPLLMLGSPAQTVFTPNSDTPYAGVNFDLSNGPMVVEIPPGAVMSVVNDLNQRYVMDLGIPGPDAGKGGKHLVLPPGWKGEIPGGYSTATTNHVLVMFRAIPTAGDVQSAIDKLKTITFYPHAGGGDVVKPQWIAIENKPMDFTPVPWETNLQYWEKLHSVIEAEPPYEAYRMEYGELAALGIAKGKPFTPDARMKGILEKAARLANAQMRVQSFADRRPDRKNWPDRQWEWASLRFENGTFDTPNYKDLEAREKWFYQAQIESPAMFRRDEHAGSLYWLGTHDSTGAYLDGARTYKLTVPTPVPAKLFWSVTVYDPYTRSEIVTPQGTAAIRSLQELRDLPKDAKSVHLYFGPKLPAGVEKRLWVQTLPDKGWFTYFRIYGPEKSAFNGSWKPGDFEEVK
jgi:hypothetical protein